MNFLEMAVLARICLRLRSSGLMVLVEGLEGAGGGTAAAAEEAAVGGATMAEATCALI